MNFDELRSKALDLKHGLLDKWDDIKANPRKMVIIAAGVFFILGVGVGYVNKAHAFQRGEVLSHMLSVCLDKQDAVEIAKVDQKDGPAAAAALFGSKEKCAPVPVQGYKVGKVVFSVPSVRGSEKVTISVVEILNGEKVEAYFMTSAPVTDGVKGAHGEALVLKPERNA